MSFFYQSVLMMEPSINPHYLTKSNIIRILFFIQVDKILLITEDLKNIGNTFFKSQNWEVAIKKYTKVLR